MFQYAFARSLAEEVEESCIILDVSDYNYDAKREYSLNHFILSDYVRTDNTGTFNKKYDWRTNYFIRVGCRLFPNLQFSFLSKKNIFVWRKNDYKQIKPKVGRDLFCFGYWQNTMYFHDHMELIRREFEIKEPIMDQNVDVFKHIKESNAVCIHIRRGDTLNRKTGLINCTSTYYTKAIADIVSKVDNPLFMVFSDDIKGARETLKDITARLEFVEQRNPDYEELRLMYSCKHFIIANSTFSWWAAFLSNNPNKIIVAPKNWYIDGRDMSGLLDPSWSIISD